MLAMSTAALLADDRASVDELEDLLWRPYTRVSFDKSGRLRSPEEQLGDLADAFARRRQRWQLGEGYQDEGSAGPRSTAKRPDFDRLLADLEGRRFGAQGLALWEVSRSTRRVGVMSRIVELCEKQGIYIYVWNHGRAYDPRRTRDWETLMEEALDAEKESRKTSERVRRSSRSDAAAGRYGGGRRPFGFQANGIEHNDEEAALVRELAELLLAGKTTRWLAAELNRRGVTTTAGNDWHPGPLAQLLRSPRLAGHRVHHGEIVKRDAWPAILDEITHRRVLACLANRAPVGRRGRTPWMLTGLLRCELCGAALVGNTDSASTGGARRYQCRKGPGYHGCGKVRIKAEPLEELLGDLATERLADVEARRSAEASAESDAPELAELAQIATERTEAIEDRRIMGRAAFTELMAKLERDEAAVNARIAAKVAQEQPLDLAAAQGGRPWAALELEEKRDRLRALISAVTVAPASRPGSTVFEGARVAEGDRIDWKA